MTKCKTLTFGASSKQWRWTSGLAEAGKCKIYSLIAAFVLNKPFFDRYISCRSWTFSQNLFHGSRRLRSLQSPQLWVATPAGCCSCASDTESTEMERGHRSPPFTSCLLGAGVCMHRQPALNLWGKNSLNTLAHSWGWFDTGVKVREQMELHTVTFRRTTGPLLTLCWLLLMTSQWMLSSGKSNWVYLFNCLVRQLHK